MLPLLSLIVSSVLLSVSANPLPSESKPSEPLPLIIWHGLGDNFENEGLTEVAELAQSVYPGTYVYIIRLGEDGSADRSASFFGNVTEQIEQVCDDIAADEKLSAAPAIDALGLSQGGVFLRGLVQRCNSPPIRSLVTFGSPHNGIADFAGCKPTDWLCRGAMGLLKTNTWGSYVQGRLVPAQYYRTTDPETGGPTEEYLEYSNFLADANNERVLKNKTYADQIAKLENFVMYMFENDTTVIPKETSWFAEVDTESGNVTDIRHRALYKSDWLGLQKLDKKGGLIFKTTPGQHMRLTDEVLLDAFKTYYGPLKKSKSIEADGKVNLEF